MKNILFVLFVLFVLFASISLLCFGDDDYSYVNTQDRFSFAQFYVGANGYQNTLELPKTPQSNTLESTNVSNIALTLGGVHFWGKADFYVTFPFGSKVELIDQSYTYNPGVETGGRWYIKTLANHSLSPFVGAGLSFPSLSEENMGRRQKITFPVSAGIAYTYYPFIFDVYAKYTADNAFNISTDGLEPKKLPIDKLSLNLGAKWTYDTTQIERNTTRQPLSSGLHYYLGAGPSTAWSTTKDSNERFNIQNMSIYNSPTNFPEFSMGVEYLWMKNEAFRTMLNLSYKPQVLTRDAFKATQEYKNSAFSFDVFQTFADYQGFTPFIGLSVASNNLSYVLESTDRRIKYEDSSIEPGIIFGWDIIPSMADHFFLRTSLRYYPNVSIKSEDEEINFPNFEFNFIQAIYRF